MINRWLAAVTGLFFAVIGGGVLWIMRFSDSGTRSLRADNLYPGLIAIGLVIFGVLTAARDFKTSTWHVTAGQLRPFLFVTGGVVAFAVIIGPGGLLPAVLATVVISAFGSRDARCGQSVVLGLCVAAAVALLFLGLLNQSMKLVAGWP
jgi:hypothetical protein